LPPKTKPKRKTGRPRKALDLRLVAALAGLQCTDGEIAAALDVQPGTITDRKQHDPAFLNAYTRGRERGKSSLRRIQWGLAKRGNARMAEWLGRQVLGQRGEQPQVNVNIVLSELGSLMAGFIREFVPRDKWPEAVAACKELDERISPGGRGGPEVVH